MALNSEDLTIKIGAEISDIEVDSSQLKELEAELSKVLSSKESSEEMIKNLERLRTVGSRVFEDIGHAMSKQFLESGKKLSDFESAYDSGLKIIGSTFLELYKRFSDMSLQIDDVVDSIRNSFSSAMDVAKQSILTLDQPLKTVAADMSGFERQFEDIYIYPFIADLEASFIAFSKAIRGTDDDFAKFVRTVSDASVPLGQLEQAFDGVIFSSNKSKEVLSEDTSARKDENKAIDETDKLLNNLEQTLKEYASESKKYTDSMSWIYDVNKQNSEAEETKNKFQAVRDAIRELNDENKKVQNNMHFLSDLGNDADKAAESTNKVSYSFKQLSSDMNKLFKFEVLKTGIRLLERGFRTIARVLKEVANAIGRIIKATANMTKNLVVGFGSFTAILVKVTTTISGLQSMLKGIVSVTKGFVSSMKNILSNIGSSLGIMPLQEFLKESVNLSSQLTEVQNRVDVVFGSAANTINEFASTAITKLGLTTYQAKDFASSFGAALKTFGKDSDSVIKMSKALTELTADLSSFYDIEQDIAKEKLFSGVISGQVKPLRQMGVDLTVASLNAYTAANGYKQLYSQMSATDKMTVRYNYTMEKLASVHGDYARTINSTANQIRLLKNNFKELSAIIGSVINAFINPLIRSLNTLLATINATLGSFIKNVLGIDWTMGIGGSSGAILDEANAFDDLAGSAEDMADSESDASDSLSKLNKEAKKALAPFHKLNVLQNKQADSAKDLGVDDLQQAVTGLSSAVSAEMPTIKDIINSLFDWLRSLDWHEILKKWADAINKFFDEAPEKIQKFFDKVQDIVKKGITWIEEFISQIDFYDIGRTLSEVLEGIFRTIETIFDNADWKMWAGKFTDFVNGLIDNVDMFKNFFGMVGSAIETGFVLVKEVAANIHWEELGENIYLGIKEGIDKIKPEDIKDALLNLANGITTALNEFFTNFSEDSDLQKKIADDIMAMFQAAGQYLSSDGFSDLVANVGKFIRQMIENIHNALNQEVEGQPGKKVKDAIGEGIGKVLSEGIQTITEFVDIGMDIWDVISTAINTGYEQLEKNGTIEVIKQKILDAISRACELLVGALTGDNEVVNSLGSFLKDAFKEIEESGLIDALKQKIIDVLLGIAGIIDTDGDAKQNANSIASAIWALISETIEEFFNAHPIATTITLGTAGLLIGAPILSSLKSLVDILSKLGGAKGAATVAASSVSGLSSAFSGLSSIGGIVSAISLFVGTIKGIGEESDSATESARHFTEAIQNMYQASNNDVQKSLDLLDDFATKHSEKLEFLGDMFAFNGLSSKEEEGAYNLSKYLINILGIAKEEAIPLAKDISEAVNGNLNNIGKDLPNNMREYLTSFQEFHANALIDQENFAARYLEIGKSMLDTEDENYNYYLQDILTVYEQLKTGAMTVSEAQNYYSQISRDAAMLAYQEVVTAHSESTDAKLAKEQAYSESVLQNIEAEKNATIEAEKEKESAINTYTDTRFQNTDKVTSKEVDDNSRAAQAVGSTWKAAHSEIDASTNATGKNMSDTAGLTVDEIKEITNNLIDWLVNDGFENIKSKLKELCDIIKTDILEAIKTVETEWENLNKRIDSWAGSMAKTMDSAARSADRLAESLKKAASAQREYTEAKKYRIQSSGRNGMPSNIPGYANGAVLQPNKPHLALLGDQKRGINIESPLSTMVEAFKAAAQNIEGGFSGNITIPVYVDGVLTTQKVITAEQMHNYRSNGR